VLSERVEKLFYQYNALFKLQDIFIRPISMTLIGLALVAATYGIFFNKAKVDYR